VRSASGWTFDVYGLAKGPVDDAYDDRRRLTQGKVRINTGVAQFELTFVTHWLRGEDFNDVKARVLQLAADRIGDLYDSLLQHAEMLESMATLGPDDPSWSIGVATNDNVGVSANLPAEVWAEVDRGLHPLQAARVWRGMSVDALAASAGLAAEAITAFETRRTKPDVDHLMALARPLRVRFHLLADEED